MSRVVTTRWPTASLSPPHHLVTRNTSRGVGCMHSSTHGRRTDSNDLDRSGMRPIGLRRSLYLGEDSNDDQASHHTDGGILHAHASRLRRSNSLVDTWSFRPGVAGLLWFRAGPSSITRRGATAAGHRFWRSLTTPYGEREKNHMVTVSN